MKRFIWNIGYFSRAVWLLHCSPVLAWDMATNSDDYFSDGYSPAEALVEELSYWMD